MINQVDRLAVETQGVACLQRWAYRLKDDKREASFQMAGDAIHFSSHRAKRQRSLRFC